MRALSEVRSNISSSLSLLFPASSSSFRDSPIWIWRLSPGGGGDRKQRPSGRRRGILKAATSSAKQRRRNFRYAHVCVCTEIYVLCTQHCAFIPPPAQIGFDDGRRLAAVHTVCSYVRHRASLHHQCEARAGGGHQFNFACSQFITIFSSNCEH